MKTSAEKYNERMDKIFAPRIAHLQKCEAIAYEILTKVESLVDIDPCGLERCHLINAITKIIDTKTNLK